MPIDYEWDEKAGLISTRLWGEVTDADIDAHTRKLFQDSRLAPPLLEIIDTRDVGKMNITARSLKKMADAAGVFKEKFSGQRSAIVAPTDVMFGMARMYEMLSESAGSPIQICAFRTFEDARAWLDGGRDRFAR